MRYTDDLGLSADKFSETKLWDEIRVAAWPELPVVWRHLPVKYIGLNSHVVDLDDVGLADGEPGFDASKRSLGLRRVTFEQCMYALSIVEQFENEFLAEGEKLKLHDTPMFHETEEGYARSEDDPAGRFAETCRGPLGSINFLQKCSRPDCTYAFSIMSQYCDKWTTTDDKNLIHLMGYLKKHWDIGIVGIVSLRDLLDGKIMNVLKTDASFANSKADRKGAGGFSIYFIGPNTRLLLTWRGRRHKVTSTSSTETEIVEAERGTKDVIPVQSLVNILLGYESPDGEVVSGDASTKRIGRQLEMDSSAAIGAIKKGYSDKLRYIRRTHGVNLAWTHERWFDDDGGTVVKRDGCEHDPDIFTKSLGASRHWDLAERLGLRRVEPLNVQ